MGNKAKEYKTMTTQATDQRKELMERFAQLLKDANEGIVQGWFDNPPGFQDALQQTLQRTLWQFQFLMTLKLGTGLQTADNFCQAITAVDRKVSPWAREAMEGSDFVGSVSRCLVEKDLYTATTEEILGQKGTNGTLKEIYAGITGRMGGELLPAEAGPQLGRQYTNQPNDEYLLVAMKPIKGSGSALIIFHVECVDGDTWLRTSCGVPDEVWRFDCPWVFSRPRRQPACQ